MLEIKTCLTLASSFLCSLFLPPYFLLSLFPFSTSLLPPLSLPFFYLL